MKISEICNTDALVSAKGKKKPTGSTVYREVDLEKIYKFEDAQYKIYCAADKKDYLTALVITTQQDELIRMENISHQSGLITIIMAILDIERKLKIRPTEELTPEGLKWLLTNLRINQYFNMVDYAGNTIDSASLKNDWLLDGWNIGIILIPKSKLAEAIDVSKKTYDNELIMPMLKWLGGKDLL